MYANIKTLNFNKQTKSMSSSPIVGGAIGQVEFTDGTIVETTNLSDMMYMKFNCPIEIQENGDVIFPETDTTKSIPANTKLKISANGLEIIA